MNKSLLLLIVGLLIAASFFVGYYVSKPVTPSNETLKSQENVLNESQCREACMEKGVDYSSDCAYDDLKLSGERVGSCVVGSGACDIKSCGCYCNLPSSTS